MVTLYEQIRPIVVVLVSRAQSERYVRALFGLLDGEERERARRMRSAPRRTAFIAAHGWRRVLLSSVAESFAPESWRFTVGPWGRPLPLPEGTGCDASLSYSGDVIAIAVSQGCRVGVDIEISAEDWADPDFLDHWTSREAVAKCLGTGICGDVPETAPAISAPSPSPPCWQEVPQAGVILHRQWIELDRTLVALAVAADVPCRSLPVENKSIKSCATPISTSLTPRSLWSSKKCKRTFWTWPFCSLPVPRRYRPWHRRHWSG